MLVFAIHKPACVHLLKAIFSLSNFFHELKNIPSSYTIPEMYKTNTKLENWYQLPLAKFV